MGHVKFDDAAIAVLRPIKERVEVRDEEGTIIGYFEPILSEYDELRRKAFASYDPERARKRRESTGEGMTTEQVLAYLKSLDNS